ncbi:MAG TPA: YrdB family protein [Devosia sp.]|nr:YrdB family protein [Devosia sp.]
MSAIAAANLALAFLIELAMLAAFAYAGWVAPEPVWLKFMLAIGIPALAILLWAVWAAPKAGKRRLTEPGLTIFKVLIFGAAAFALWASGQAMFAAIFGALAAINLIAAWLLGQVSWPKRA